MGSFALDVGKTLVAIYFGSLAIVTARLFFVVLKAGPHGYIKALENDHDD